MRMFKKTVSKAEPRKHRRRSLWATLRMPLRGERSWRAFSTSSLFPTTRHVVDERPIDVGASKANGIEEEICIYYKILLVS